MENIFYSFSKKICGNHTITEDMSNYYFELLKSEYGDSYLDFLSNLDSGNQSEEQYAKFKRIILYLWFSSELIQSNEVDDFLDTTKEKFSKKQEYIASSPTPYYSALIWPSIKSHPIGLTGGYFGHWKYIPEN